MECIAQKKRYENISAHICSQRQCVFKICLLIDIFTKTEIRFAGRKHSILSAFSLKIFVFPLIKVQTAKCQTIWEVICVKCVPKKRRKRSNVSKIVGTVLLVLIHGFDLCNSIGFFCCLFISSSRRGGH